MSTAVESEQELAEEAIGILRRNLPPHKVALLLSIWQIGREDYANERNALFKGKTVNSLFEHASGH